MALAEVGDDVFGDDPSIQALQDEAAALLGFEAALFAPSGTQSNLIGIMAQCGRGDEVILGQWAHTYRWEGGGMAVLGSIQPQPIDNEPDGSLPLARIRASIKPDDPHFARTKLLALENTFQGKVLPVRYLDEAKQLAREAGLGLHLDGARLFNAAVAMAAREREPGQPARAAAKPPRPILAVAGRNASDSGLVRSPVLSREDVARQARRICDGFDSVSICLSKGLGCPVGSLILGSAEIIRHGRRIRKMLGGGMRQAGFLAAAGRYALTYNLVRLEQDHQLAMMLADGLHELVRSRPGLEEQIAIDTPQTNMLFIQVDPQIAASLATHLNRDGIRFTASKAPNGRIQQRWVTHLDVDTADVEKALASWRVWADQ